MKLFIAIEVNVLDHLNVIFSLLYLAFLYFLPLS